MEKSWNAYLQVFPHPRIVVAHVCVLGFQVFSCGKRSKSCGIRIVVGGDILPFFQMDRILKIIACLFLVFMRALGNT